MVASSFELAIFLFLSYHYLYKQMEVIMKTNKEKLQEELIRSKLIKFESCSPEESNSYEVMLQNNESLPDGIISLYVGYKRNFYKLLDFELDYDNVNILINLRKMKYLKVMCICIVIFTVMLILSAM